MALQKGNDVISENWFGRTNRQYHAGELGATAHLSDIPPFLEEVNSMWGELAVVMHAYVLVLYTISFMIVAPEVGTP